ncbi:MAG: hypothetical protein NVSMB43_07280 [Pseudarthrobacter sp.]
MPFPTARTNRRAYLVVERAIASPKLLGPPSGSRGKLGVDDGVHGQGRNGKDPQY